MFGKNHIKKPIKNIDKIATWLILGGIVASVYGIKKYDDKKKKSLLCQEKPKKKDSLRLAKALFRTIFNKNK